MVWLVAGCTSGGVEPRAEGQGVSTAPPPSTPPVTAAGDVELVRALIAGEVSPAEVVQEVAWSGGWPVRDGDSAWFVVESDQPGWSVAGDFSGWEPVPATAGAGFSWVRVEVVEPEGQQYKWVRADAWSADPVARSYTFDAYGEISYVAAPVDAPRLDRWPALAGEDLKPRDLRVWVPGGAGPWPVLYAHDGQNLFDPASPWGGWRLQESLTSREPVLVVGIDNTVDRTDEYTHVPDDIGDGTLIGGRADEYAGWIEDHVRPHVEATYGSTGHDGLLGSSLGGLVSLVAAERSPGSYDFVASLSGTLGWGKLGADEPTIEQLWLAAPPVGTAVYVDSGGGPGADDACVDLDGDGASEDDPDASDNYCETRQFADALAAAGWVWDETLWHWWEPGAPHQEDAWADRVGRPIDLFLSLR